MADEFKAPKERINVTYKTHVGDAEEEKELPLKLLMLGDYTLAEDEDELEDRKPRLISDKEDFPGIMEGYNLSLDLNVPNRLSNDPEATMSAKLKFSSMKDFTPEKVVEQVEPLKKLLEARQALAALKNPLANKPGFRKKLQAALADDEKRDNLLSQLIQSHDNKG